MKGMKRWISLALIFVMLFAMTPEAFAAKGGKPPADDTSSTIVINQGETYTFDMNVSEPKIDNETWTVISETNEARVISTNKVVVNKRRTDATATIVYTGNQATSKDTITIIYESDTSTQTFTKVLEVKAVAINNPPVITGTYNFTLDEDGVLTFNITATDIEDGEVLSYSGSNGTHGSVAVDTAGKVTYSPNADYNGPDNFEIKVTDSKGSFDTENVSVIINAVNDLPVFTSEHAFTMQENDTLSFEAVAGDVDNESLTYTVDTDPFYGTVTENDGIFTYVPNIDYVGEDTFIIAVSDAFETVKQTITVTVDEIIMNEAPVFISPDTFKGTENEILKFTAEASDPEDDLLVYGIETMPAVGTLTVTDGIYTYTPSENNTTDVVTFSINVTDGIHTVVQNITITWSPVNHTPVAVNDSFYAKTSETILFDVLFNDFDSDEDQLIVSLPENSPYVVIGNEIAFLETQEGTYRFSYYVSDGAESVEGNVMVTVDDNMIYVALGDSIPYGILGTGIVASNYTQQFADNLNLTSGSTYINRSVSGHNAKDLYNLLDDVYNSEYEYADQDVVEWVKKAEVITICIGANDIMDAASRSSSGALEKYNIDWGKADYGRAQFELYWPQIIDHIEYLNPDVTIVAMNIYNPYRSSDSYYQLVDKYFYSENSNAYGLNDIIENTKTLYQEFLKPTLKYDYANVYLAFNASSNKDDLTDFYNTISILWFSVNACDPHPTQEGQNLIFNVHKDKYTAMQLDQ
ncbi:MAG: tandem-95 repeat protein [Clostridia bacterium]|nr:tandem-95 repeat protein [Clostridia bacterium]